MDKKYCVNELTKYSKADIINMFISLQSDKEKQDTKMQELNQKMDLLFEQLSVSKQHRFGRSSEKMKFEDQMELYFNEAEVLAAEKVPEPELEEVCPKAYKRKKHKGKREEDLKNIPVTIIEHTLSEEQLRSTFGEKWRRLPDEVYKRLALHPVQFEVEEHHVAVYCGNDNQTIVKASRPTDLLRNSIVTPSLEAAILNSKYINALPLNRIEQEFARNDVMISRQVMANWTILCGERYLSLLYDRLHQELYKCKVSQADETPVIVSKDGRATGSKSYMWVYRTGKLYNAPPIILYDYQRTRNSSHPKDFLKKYQGVLVTDGYQVYHQLEKEESGITIAGCWSHARRRYADVVKTMDKEAAKSTLAYAALRQIAMIYKIDNDLIELTPEDRVVQRQLLVKPQVEAFFAWIKNHKQEVASQSETGKGFTYCINQEKYLKTFLTNGDVPLDNNATESAIRGFCIGKNNWHMIDTIEGAKSSAIIYSIAETAKANNLKPYEYFKYLLKEIPQHMDDKDLTFLDKLLPWSDQLPEQCRKQTKQ
ncbi:transposase [Ruminiclostridium papyrosolvens DSM 2782]|uniref:Transposase n=1 Tax=Ruminiclostridium papyrosolvens DSM 2782 TaxID=588581 RepID=F1TDK7_9FIRM|nr:IS66 family transposase [Ruminiclostridium papyrosolvens]EGD47645.1 transposase [Ruminiclostridium papyrosolvens DSM 2782]WES36391.1 IS66 family transposase [Ruminiclostridium papyrosolvens DSM 2782]WES36411.1 IS66 family transposase [Ruminiclostridium papyrosolvens DSM 2782]